MAVFRRDVRTTMVPGTTGGSDLALGGGVVATSRGAPTRRPNVLSMGLAVIAHLQT
jgi:hypothetical protein